MRGKEKLHVVQWLAIALLMLCVGGADVLAQSVALGGRVTDPQGAAVAGAIVRVAPASGASPLVAVTGADGAYEIANLPAGPAVVRVEASGFRRAVRSTTLAAPSVSLDVTLEVSGVDEAVVVTAAGLPQADRETSKAVATIEADEIRRRHQLLVADIVRAVPGAQVRDTGGPGQSATLRLRGLRGDATSFLLDGFRLRDAASAQSDFGAFFSNLNFVAADRIEVLRGSGSSLYGTNAVGGVVNIVSAAGGGPLRGEGGVEYGSLGQLRARGAVAGSAAGGRIAFAAGGVGWDVADGLDGRDAARSEGAHGTVRVQINPMTRLSVRYLGSRDRAENNTSPTTRDIPAGNIPDAIVIDAVAPSKDAIEHFNDGGTLEAGNATFFPSLDDPDSRRRSAFQSLAARLERQVSPTAWWQASYQRVHTSRTYLNGPLGPGFQTAAESVSDFVGDIDTFDVRATVTPRPWLAVTAGYELEREAYFEHLDDNLPPPSRLISELRVAQLSHAAFGAAQLALLDRRLQVAVSGRAQAFRPRVPRFSTAGTTNPYEDVPLETPPGAVTGDVSAAYFVARTGTKVRAHVGNAYRAPALYERFGGGFFSDPGQNIVIFSPFGDPRLEPDRYRTVDAGIDQYLWRERALVSATVFNVDVQSLTAFDFAGGIDPATDPYGRFSGYLNGSGGFSRGVELGVDMRPARALRVRAAYTYTNAETDEDLSVEGFFKVPSVSPHTASFVVSHAWRDALDSTVEILHVSSSYTPLSANGRPRAYRFPAYTTVNAVASWRVPSAAAPLRVYVRAENLLDETYYVGGWRALGRTAAIGLSIGY